MYRDVQSLLHAQLNCHSNNSIAAVIHKDKSLLDFKGIVKLKSAVEIYTVISNKFYFAPLLPFPQNFITAIIPVSYTHLTLPTNREV